MKYEEAYYGWRVIVTTLQEDADTWTSRVEVVEDGESICVAHDPQEAHAREDDARRAGFSAAAAAIDRARASRGKP